MYNIACAQISSGDYYAARSSLSSAARICHDVLSSEGMTDEEIKAESTAIRLQTSFVDILTGRETDASLEQCKDVLKSIKKDNELLAVAANNLAVLRGATDLPDSLRRLRNTISTASEEKLTRSQLMEIRYNRCVLLLHMKKIDECLRTLDELDKMYGVTSRSVMIRSAINSLSGDYLNCAKSLEEDIKKLSGSSDITLLSALLAQLYINQGSYAEAESQISALNQLKYSPAGISAIYQLKILQDPNGSTAMKYLLSAAESLTNSAEDVSDSTRTAALFQISQELEKHQFYQESANVLQSLLTRCAESIDSSERLMASAKLAIALSYVKPAEAQKSARSLPKV